MSTECDSSIEHEDVSQYKKGGYHPVEVGDLFVNRYLVKKKIGWGQFSTVWLCEDIEEKVYVALKISKSALYYSEAAVSEMDILMKISEKFKENNLSGRSQKLYVVSLLNHFTHRGPNGRHVIMVFEILGMNLLEVIKAYNYKGIPLAICRSFISQILIGLDFIHRTCGIIHTDLKPENILLELTKHQLKELTQFGEVKTQITRRIEKLEELPKHIAYSRSEVKFKKPHMKLPCKKKKVDSKLVFRQEYSLPQPQSKKIIKRLPKSNEINFSPSLQIKVVDFGNAVYSSGLCNNEIQTRQYRAPEVILGIRFSGAADMWSLGCIAFELVTGELLFQPNKGEGFTEDDDHLAAIWETLGDFPVEWALSTKNAWKYFVKGSLKKIQELHPFLLRDMLITRYNFSVDVASDISEFLIPLLQVIPEFRITAEDCLKHPWLGSGH